MKLKFILAITVLAFLPVSLSAEEMYSLSTVEGYDGVITDQQVVDDFVDTYDVQLLTCSATGSNNGPSVAFFRADGYLAQQCLADGSSLFFNNDTDFSNYKVNTANDTNEYVEVDEVEDVVNDDLEKAPTSNQDSIHITAPKILVNMMNIIVKIIS